MRKDNRTAELPGVPRRPGRPPKPDALSPAERARRYRANKKEAGAVALPQEKTYTEAQYEQVCRSMRFAIKSMWQMENTIGAMQREQALLIEERAKLFAEVERLQALLSK